MRRSALVAAGVALTVLLLVSWRPPSAAAQSPFFITSSVTYDVRPDQGETRVTWQLDIQNNDPTTVLRDEGFVYFYDRYGVPVLRGASGFSARGPGGGALQVTMEDPGEGPFAFAVVHFDRNLYYGQSYSFSLVYELFDARAESLLVTPYYVFLPALTTGDSSSVRVNGPADRGWDVTLQPASCREVAAREYECEASESVLAAALVEVARPDALETLETTVAVASASGRDIPLSLQYYPGEGAWAAHVEELAKAAYPVFEELFGFSRDATSVEISERGQQEIFGYRGITGCLLGTCRIGISPISDDVVALHEMAHLWTQPFASRWLAEGLAEFMARRAADTLGPLVRRGDPEVPERFEDLPLHEWETRLIGLGASEEELIREDSAYRESLRFFDTLEQTVGLEAIQAANHAAAEQRSGVDSRNYLDYLEEASGARLDGLFLEEVFPPSFAQQLDQRRKARDLFAFLNVATEKSGLRLPSSLETAIENWAFDHALDRLGEARDALGALTEAQEGVEQSDSLWERFGLMNRDPDVLLSRSSDAFAAGEFDEAAELAATARSIADEANEVALARFLVALGMFIAVVGGASVTWWLGRRRPASSALDAD